jgi:cell division protein FtsL
MNKENNHFTFDELYGNKQNHCEYGENGVFEYFEDQLLEEDRQKFEQHLTACSQCPAKLAALQDMELAVLKTELDSDEANRIFTQNRAKIETYLNQKYPSAKPQPSQEEGIFSRFFRIFAMPGYANAMVVALLLVLIYPAYKSMQLNQEVTRLRSDLNEEKARNSASSASVTEAAKAFEKQIQELQEQQQTLMAPTLSASVVQAARTERSGETETITVPFSTAQRSFNILFSVPSHQEAYQVQIIQNEKVVWEEQFHPSQSADAANVLISMNLRAGYLAEGTYHLVISGIGKGGSSKLATYRLKISGK